MNQNVSEKVIDKIRKLMNHAESAAKIGSVEEAQAFNDKVQALLIEHELEMSQIPLEMRDAREETIDRECFIPAEKGWSGPRKQYWLDTLAQAVARAHFCSLLVSRSDNRVWFVGKPANRAVCIFMYEYLIRTARNLNFLEYTKAKRQAVKDGEPERIKGFITAFYEAFANRIQTRYVDMRRAADANTSTALVLRSTEAQLQKYMSQFKGHSRPPQPKGSNAAGYEAGDRVGREVNLNVKGVEQGKSKTSGGRLS